MLPARVDPCECGADDVLETEDGITTRYECGACGALLADLLLGAGP